MKNGFAFGTYRNFLGGKYRIQYKNKCSGISGTALQTKTRNILLYSLLKLKSSSSEQSMMEK